VGPTIVAIIGSCIGGFWAMLGASGLESRWRPLAFVCVLATTAVLVTALPWLTPLAAPGGSFRLGVYIAAVIAELLAIAFVASPPLKLYRRKELLLPAVGVTLGLHFIGLWRAMNSSIFLLIAIALCLISAGAAFLPERDEQFCPRRLLLGFGCAAVLWLNAGAALV
jgi:hypothetical protein